MTFEIKINDKLSLKFPKTEEAQEIYEIVDKNREHLRKWLAWVDMTTSASDIEKNITERIERFEAKKSASFYAYYEGKWIASVGYVSIDNINKLGEIGYWIDSEYEGRGLMTECVKACIKYGFEDLDLHRIVIRCSENNNKSSAIPERLGFTMDGKLREDHLINGVYENTKVWSLLKGESKA